MNNRKSSGYSVKSNISISLLLIKQFFNCCLNNFIAVILCVILTGLVVSTAHAEGKNTTYSFSEQLTPFDYLGQHKNLPVDFLLSVFYVSDKLQKKLPADKISHPFYESLEYEGLTRKPLRYALDNLNHLISYDDGNKYIDQKLLISVTSIPVFHRLLEEYASIYYLDNNKTHVLTVTIGGMLYDLQQRKDSGDVIAARVLEALKYPYVKPHDEPDDNQSFFLKWPKVLRQLFSSTKASPFSDQMMLTDLPYTDNKLIRYQRLQALKQKGYQYKKNYTFISYETDADGKIITTSSNDILQTEAEVQKALADDYADLPDEASATINIAGMKFADKTANKISAFALSGMFFLSMINSGVTSAIPPQCEAEGNCNPQNYHSLYNNNFTMALRQNSTGYFKLAENITLNTQHGLPVSPNCNQPFSGVLNTGNYTIHAGSGASSLFGCVDNAHISGNVNVCPTSIMHTQPVIADQLVNNSTVNMQQMGQCSRQRPLLGDISGHNNRVSFIDVSREITVADDVGIVANSVSGSSNVIAAEGGHLLNASVVSVAGGNNNTYHQKNMNIVRYAEEYQLENEFLLANRFTGNETTIVQHGINATFNVPAVPNNIQNRTISDTQNRTITLLSSDTVIEAYPPEESIRLTNISDNSEQRSVITNNGRLEVYRNGKWGSICEDGFSEKNAHVACRLLGHKKAETERKRLHVRGRFLATSINSMSNYAKECFGYEENLQRCLTGDITNKNCLPGTEAFLSCSDDTTVGDTILTDFNTNSPLRFDTTDTRQGRLEQKSLSGERHTVCSTGFTDQSANVACESMGYPGGSLYSGQVVPLPDNIPILAFNWSCTGSETSLLQCAYQNLTSHNCTHNNDVALRCNSAPVHEPGLRLTDRQSDDNYRATITSTGLGRLEAYHQATNSSIPFCSLDDLTVNNTCKYFGFERGAKYSLTAKPLLLPEYYTNHVVSLICVTPDSCYLHAYYDPAFEHCPFGDNKVILCDDGLIERPQIQTRLCPRSNQISGKTVLFTGKFDLSKMNCKFDQCPVMYWDADGVNSNFLDQQCREQQLHTTVPKDWMKMWDIRCQDKQGDCNCHLPNEQILGFASQNSGLNETLLISRQNYRDNDDASARGLILVRRLHSDGSPQVLQAANETLALTLPVNHVVTDQHLLGLYSNRQGNGSAQLLWSSLDPDNSEYHVRTLSVDGKPLLLTENNVFVKNNQSRTIMQHEINTQMHDPNTVEFDINTLPEIINFPDDIKDIYTAAARDGWLYIAGSNSTDTNQVYVMRYNISANLWDPDWEQTYTFSQNTRMFVDNYNRLQFLSSDQIPLTTARVLLPDEGGCASFSGEVTEIAAPSTTMPLIPTMTSEINITNNSTTITPSTTRPVEKTIMPLTPTMTLETNITDHKTTTILPKTTPLTGSTIPPVETTIVPIPTIPSETEATDDKQAEIRFDSLKMITGVASGVAAITGFCCACGCCILKDYGCKNKKCRYGDNNTKHSLGTIEKVQ